MKDQEVPDSLRERFAINEAMEPGSTGPRWRATDKTSGRKGVLVLVDASALPASSDRQRVRRELAKQATLSHPHLALPAVTGEAGKHVYFLRDDVPGTTLRARLAAGPLQPSEAMAVATQVAAGLDELHRAGLLFRDLRPDRIVLQDGGHVVLVEAGLAAPIEDDETIGVQGTPEYVSPEQAKGKLQSFRSDLYALGVILHEMVTGKAPHVGEVSEVLEAHRDGEAPQAPEALPEPVRELHQQLLSREPRKRPFSAQAVRRALNPFLPPELQSAEQPSPGSKKKTMLGMPAVGPARPPSMAPAKPPSMAPKKEEPKAEAEPERKPGTTPRNPDATQQVALSDIIEERELPKSQPPPSPGPTSAPPPPPSGETAVPAEVSADAAPGSAQAETPAAKSVETTQPLDAVDILDEEEQVAPAPAVAAPETSGAPASAAVEPAPSGPASPVADATGPAAAAASADQAGAHPTSDAAAFPEDPVPAPDAAADPGGLDYDDLAETIARESPAGLGSMSPSVPAGGAVTAAGGSGQMGGAPMGGAPTGSGSATAPGTHGAPATGAAAAAPHGAQSAPVQAQPASGSKQGVYFLAGGGLIFLAVCLFIGWQIISSSAQEETPVALGPAAAAAAGAAAAQNAPAVAPTPPASTEAKPPEDSAEEPEGMEAEAAGAEAEEAAEGDAVEAEAAETAEESAEAEAAEAEAEEADAEPEERTASARRGRSTMRSSAMAGGSSAMASGGSAFDQTREQARQAFQQRNFPLAAQLYQRATAMNPRHAGSWAGLGAARMQMRNYSGAVQAYQRAVTLSPRHSGFFTALGHAYRSQGNTDGARQAYQRALALNPANRSAQSSLQSL